MYIRYPRIALKCARRGSWNFQLRLYTLSIPLFVGSLVTVSPQGLLVLLLLLYMLRPVPANRTSQDLAVIAAKTKLGSKLILGCQRIAKARKNKRANRNEL
jgi:hypothetical protein